MIFLFSPKASCLGLLVRCLGLGFEPQCLGLGLYGTYCRAPITVYRPTRLQGELGIDLR